MFVRLQHLVTAAILGLGSAASAQAAPPADGLCIEDTQIDRALGVALERLVATSAVTLRAPGQCADAQLLGRFSGLDPVVFTLHTAGGERFARAVPWLIRPDAALARLRAQRRLSGFAVLIEGLLAEWRIATGPGESERRPAAADPDAGATPAAPARADTARPRRARATPARRARRVSSAQTQTSGDSGADETAATAGTQETQETEQHPGADDAAQANELPATETSQTNGLRFRNGP